MFKRMVHKFKHNHKNITIILFFDGRGKKHYILQKDKRDIVEKNILLINNYISDFIKLNSDIIGDSRIKIQIKITKFQISSNFAAVEHKTKSGDFYMSLSIDELSNKINPQILLHQLFLTIRHEFTHTQQKPIDRSEYNKINSLFSDQIYNNLLVTIDFMQSEGFAMWSEYFNKHVQVSFLDNKYLRDRNKFKKRLYSVKKSDGKPLSAYAIAGNLPYNLGYHIYIIITLDFLKRNSDVDYKLINRFGKVYSLDKLFRKSRTLYLYPVPNKRLLKQLFTYFKLMDRFKFIEAYLLAFSNLGFKHKYLLFKESEIKKFLELKKYLK